MPRRATASASGEHLGVAVDGYRLARNRAAAFACQKKHLIGDLARGHVGVDLRIGGRRCLDVGERFSQTLGVGLQHPPLAVTSDDPGQDRIDAHAVLAQFDGQRFRKADHAPLGRPRGLLPALGAMAARARAAFLGRIKPAR